MVGSPETCYLVGLLSASGLPLVAITGVFGVLQVGPRYRQGMHCWTGREIEGRPRVGKFS